MLRFSEFSEDINYKHHDPTDVDAKLIHRALHQHLSDPSNYDRHAVGEEPVHVKNLNIPRAVKSKYKNTKIVLPTNLPHQQSGYYDQKMEKRKLFGKELPKIFDKREHHIAMRVDGNTHQEFLHNLKHNSFDAFRHELEHHKDLADGSKLNQIKTLKPKTFQDYHNLDHEVTAFTAERKHQIHKAFIQNHKDLWDTENGGHLPLKDRMKKFRDSPMQDKLTVIDRHSAFHYGHSGWYGQLTPENKKKVDSHFQPIIDRHMGK